MIYNTVPTINHAPADIVLGQPDFTSNTPNNGGISERSLYNPRTVYSDGTRLFIADRSNNRVLIYNTIPTVSHAPADFVLGQPDFTSNAPNNGGLSERSLQTPLGIYTVDERLIVSDHDNNRVLIYNAIPTENFARADIVLGQPDFISNTSNNGGLSDSSLSHPYGVSSDGIRLFIADISNHRVVIHNSIPTETNASADIVLGQPDFITNTPNYNSINSNSLYHPYGVSTDGVRLYISDTYNHRVLIHKSIPIENYAQADFVLGQPDFTSNIPNNGGVSEISLKFPNYAFCSGVGQLFIADSQNNRVVIHNMNGDTIYVNDSATGLNDGTSWANAYTDLQDALSTALSGDEIWVAAGTYIPSQVGDRNATLQLINNVELYGGFNGTETQRGQRDFETNVTILSGDLNGDDGPYFANNGENSYHVVTGSNTDSSAILDGFFITGGNACEYYGGGMNNEGGSPTVTNCTFSGNSANWDGGGMSSRNSSSPTLTNCTFSGNSADMYGGGMSNFFSSPILTNCTFSGNSAQDSGGGMLNEGGSPTLTNCTFYGNSADIGGGIFNEVNSNPTLTNCILWGDSPDELYNYSSSPVVSYSNIQGGYAGIGNIDADPLFIDPDGPDDILGTEDDDLRLSAGSSSIDAGDNDAVPTDTLDLDGDGDTTEPIPYDLAGNARFIDDPATTDTGNGTAPIIDMGAYEYKRGPIYVDQNATGNNDGSSWADAYVDLQDALGVSTTGDEIWAAAGTYIPSQIGDRTATFQLINDVELYGGFNGTEIQRDERDFETNVTILSGDLNGNDGPDFVNNGENSYHVVIGSDTDSSAVLDGFFVTGGNAIGGGNNVGGGMLNESGSPTLTNCTFSSNSAIYSGGGMFNDNSSSPTLTNCTFSGNSANNLGGGMFNYSSSPTLTNCIFSGNLAHSGGGMANDENSSPTLTNCTFSGNSASRGGGMFNYNYSSPTLTNCTFNGNSAAYAGGGMSNESYSSPTLTNCTFNGNSSWYDNGGGMSNKYNANPTVTNCTFSGNSADDGGSGMSNRGSSSILTNCTFSNNTASSGGGLYNWDGSNVTVTNSILWGNFPQEIYNSGSSLNIRFSNIRGGYGGTANINANPLFIDPDGPDDIPGTEDDDFRLMSGSPSIDSANNFDVPADTFDLDGDGDTTEPLPYDLGGNVRFYDDPLTADTGNGTAPIVDMGAYEYNDINHPPVAEDISDQTDEDTAVDITLLATDPDNDPLDYFIVDDPSFGSIVLIDDVATYTPDTNYYGEDTFTYKANDGDSDSNTATVTITINPVNDAPILDSIGDKVVDEGDTLSFTVTASDVEGDSLSLTGLNLPSGASFTDNGDGTGDFDWTPGYDQSGEYTDVQFEVGDDGSPSMSDNEQITITVNNIEGFTCTIEPQAAIDDGAQWRLTAGPDTNWHNSGDTITGLPDGDYRVRFRNTYGWSRPVDQVIPYIAGDYVEVLGTYVPIIEQGSISVTIEPQEAIDDGAQWRMTVGPDTGWYDSGDVISSVPVSTYTIRYRAVYGWERPANQSVEVTSGGTATTTG
ncbi:MAG: right-handed parallel beta-helix repeat-containing protein, partial [Candidatus Omnitrophica bacterium]|nr:right-handed parallel beta-helix repeat-containing protein [Candidatus Omnitrophota bacterium]